MDPTETLRQALRIAERLVRHADDKETYPTLHDDATALAERVNSLNDWLSRGNRPPMQWPIKYSDPACRNGHVPDCDCRP